jgi:hypothetical protein
MKNHTPTNNQEIRDTLMSFLGEDGIRFGQAVSICACVVEMGLIRATIDDVADGLYQRFQGLLDRKHIIEASIEAIEFGIVHKLIEPYTDGSFTLTEDGIFVGRDWSKQIAQNNF